MLRVIDRLAGRWFDWRQDREIAKVPEIRDLGFHKAEVTEDGAFLFQLVGGQREGGPVSTAIAYMADEAAAMLQANKAENYVQFDMMPRLDREVRPIRVTVQYASGESPARKAARLLAENERLRSRVADLEVACGVARALLDEIDESHAAEGSATPEWVLELRGDIGRAIRGES